MITFNLNKHKFGWEVLYNIHLWIHKSMRVRMCMELPQREGKGKRWITGLLLLSAWELIYKKFAGGPDID